MPKLLQVRYIPNDENIEKVSDGNAEKFVLDKISKIVESAVLLTSQEMVIDWVRIAVSRGLIDHQEVEFLYKDYIMLVDRFGRLDWWPQGFCDYKDNILAELIEKGV